MILEIFWNKKDSIINVTCDQVAKRRRAACGRLLEARLALLLLVSSRNAPVTGALRDGTQKELCS